MQPRHLPSFPCPPFVPFAVGSVNTYLFCISQHWVGLGCTALNWLAGLKLTITTLCTVRACNVSPLSFSFLPLLSLSIAAAAALLLGRFTAPSSLLPLPLLPLLSPAPSPPPSTSQPSQSSSTLQQKSQHPLTSSIIAHSTSTNSLRGCAVHLFSHLFAAASLSFSGTSSYTHCSTKRSTKLVAESDPKSGATGTSLTFYSSRAFIFRHLSVCLTLL